MRTTSVLRFLAIRASPTARAPTARASQPGSVALPRGAAWSSDSAACTVSVLRGTAWVTVAGDPLDHVVCAGESFVLRGSAVRRLAVQALTDLAFRIAPPAGPGAQHPPAAEHPPARLRTRNPIAPAVKEVDPRRPASMMFRFPPGARPPRGKPATPRRTPGMRDLGD